MPRKAGVTLMEIIVTLVIIGSLATITLPSYLTRINLEAARAARNNLLAIYNAQKGYYLGPGGSGSYCTTQTPNPQLGCAVSAAATCAQDLPSIDCNLSLNIIDTNFSYKCTGPVTTFSCIATNNADAAFTITIAGPPTQIVLPNTNPTCAYAAHPNYCPN
jgi:prepilin-type N-terminal cleavage/methylation domain-containing protein